MRVLALDTTTREGSAAIVEDGRIVVEQAGNPARSHAERLPSDLTDLLGRRHVTTSDVDLFAVAAGPGSFTGLRIGIATMQGLAFVTRRRIVAVSILDALAQLAGQGLAAGGRVAAWMDAHRGEVFSALYQVTESQPFVPERLIEIDPPSVGAPAIILSRWSAERKSADVFAGDGALLYARLLPKGRTAPAPVLAGVIGLMAYASPNRSVDPAGVQPIYIRRPDAEVARDTAQSRSL